MRKLMSFIHLLGFLLLVPVTFMYAQQSITLTFTAEHDSTISDIDSVYIINTTRQCLDVIYHPQTTYVLNSTVGIEAGNSQQMFSLTQNYPNPFAENTRLDFSLDEAQDVRIFVNDITGRLVASYNAFFQQGKHTLSYSGGAAGMYVLSVSTKTHLQSVRLNKTGHQQYAATLSNVGMQPAFEKRSGSKNFQWVPGDNMAFVAFTTAGLPALGVAVVSDVPVADTTYLFDIQTNTCANFPYAVDLDGNVYQTVQIGNQCWMRETLRTSTYKNGTPIPLVTSNTAWSGQSAGAYTYFDNDPATASTYGYMYNGHTVITGNLCPTGWHVPSISEWQQLATYLGANSYHCGTNTSWVAKAMASNTGWSFAAHACAPGNNLATNNASGLTIMPAGFRNHSDGLFYTQDERAYIWTTDNVQGWPNSYYYIFVDYSDFGITTTFMSDIRAGHTVRCIKD